MSNIPLNYTREPRSEPYDYYLTSDDYIYCTSSGEPYMVLASLSDEYYNASDLNRVEAATLTLRDRLAEYGYSAGITERAVVLEHTTIYYVEDEDGNTTREVDHVETIRAHRNWLRTDFPMRGEIDRIRRNIDALQRGFYSLPEWRDIIYNNTVDMEQANAYEWDLHQMDIWTQRMIALFRHSGAAISGMTGGLIL